MDSVIPQVVLDHLRELANQSGDPLRGGWTTEQLAEAMDISRDGARNIVRRLLRHGQVRGRRVGIDAQQAIELGYLGCGSVMVYYLTEES